MNGLKFIRIRCNYSQAELAYELGVFRFMIRNWESSKKKIPDNIKIALENFFGVENPDWFDEIDIETAKEILSTPLSKIQTQEGERFRFAMQNNEKYRYLLLNDDPENLISLDEKCNRKRKELKALSKEIRDYCESEEECYSFDSLLSMNRIQAILGGIFNALKSAQNPSITNNAMRFYILKTIIDAINIAFGNSLVDEQNKQDMFPKELSGVLKNFRDELLEVFSRNIDEFIKTKKEITARRN